MDCFAIYLMAFSIICAFVYIVAYICSKFIKKYKDVLETLSFICGFTAVAGGLGSIFVSGVAIFFNYFT